LADDSATPNARIVVLPCRSHGDGRAARRVGGAAL